MDKVPTQLQISAGGVVFRPSNQSVEVVLISVGPANRWQLPKGLVNAEEANETAAVREVREETGLETELLSLIDKIEYWYYSKNRGQQVRFHKFVYFYMLRYQSGDVANHDHEVNEARWLEIDQAITMLAFASEKKIVQQVKAMVGRF